MRISSRGRYGLRAMVDLASQDEDRCITLKSIAERQGISEHYLEQLIAPLKKAGFVKSIRGAQGGYRLNEKPCNITVGDMLRVLEGSLLPSECLEEGDASCGTASCDGCVAKGVWEKMYQSLNEVLDGITLAHLVEEYKEKGLILDKS